MIKVCITGYYGFDNLADEATLLSIIESLRNHIEDVEIVVFSDDPEGTAQAYGVISYDCHQWSKLHKGIRECDVVICGDSSLMREKTDLRSCYHYTRVIRMAVRRKKPIFVYGQGFTEDIENPLARKLAVSALQKVSRITVRDQKSFDCLRHWGLRRGRISVAGNPLLNLTSLSHCWDVEKFTALAEQLKDKAEKEENAAMGAAQKETKNNFSDPGDQGLEVQIVMMDPEEFAALDQKKSFEKTNAAENLDIPMEQFATVVPDDFLPKEESLAAADQSVDAETPVEIEIIVGDSIDEIIASVRQDEATAGSEETAEDTADVPVEELRNDVTCSHRLLTSRPEEWALEDTKLAVFFLGEEGKEREIPIADLVTLADDSVRFGYTVVFVPFQYERDLPIAKTVLSQMTEFAELFDAGEALLPQEVMDIIAAADLVFGMELPVLIMAALKYKPFAALSGDEEVREFCYKAGIPLCGDLEQYNNDSFLANYRKIVEDTDSAVAALEKNLPRLSEESNQINFLLDVIIQRVIRRSGHVKRTRAEKIAMLEERKAARAAESETAESAEEEAADFASERENDISYVDLDSLKKASEGKKVSPEDE